MYKSKQILLTGFKDLSSPPHANIPGLDVLRSLAILLVVCGHYLNGKIPLFNFGWSGVDLFFVLSGFLIGKQLWKELKERGTINIPRFLLRRGLRIWPYYYAFLVFLIFTTPTPAKKIFPDAIFISNYIHNHVPGGWSLSTEEQFYILMPIILLLGTRVVPLKFGYVIPVTFFILLPIGRFFIFAFHHGIITDEIRQQLTYTYLHTHSDGLIVGIMVSWLSVFKKGFANKIPFKQNILLPAFLIILGMALRIANNLIFAFTSLALIFGGMLIFALRDNSKLAKIFRWHGFYLTSRLSYGMYLNHLPLFWLVSPFILAIFNTNNFLFFWLGITSMLLLSIITSFLTFLLIESPFLQLRQRIFSKHSQS